MTGANAAPLPPGLFVPRAGAIEATNANGSRKLRDLLNDLHDNAPVDPVRAARDAMQPALPKRFYEAVTVEAEDDGFVVCLDGRPAKTPGRMTITLTTRLAAQIVADEFAAQVDRIDPDTMPAWRLVNTAIDGVSADPQAVIEDVLRFFGSDLLCYRADGPEKLIAAQREKWDPPLQWAEGEAGGRFNLAEGVMHVAQPQATIRAMGTLVRQITDPVALAALHSMTTLTGSAILAYGVIRDQSSAASAWSAAHVDEDFNIAQWGEDAEAKAARDRRWTEMEVAARMAAALRKEMP